MQAPGENQEVYDKVDSSPIFFPLLLLSKLPCEEQPNELYKWEKFPC